MSSTTPGPTPTPAQAANYPKLQVAAPFTPATGRRLLVARDAPAGAHEALVAGLREVRRQVEASSFHSPSRPPRTPRGSSGCGFLVRHGEQFHFLCDGFPTFDDFLAALASRKRKAIKRERRDALGDGVTIEWVTGSSIRSRALGCFFTSTWTPGRASGAGRISPGGFFSARRGARRPDPAGHGQAQRPLHRRRDQLIGDDALYGRNWGAIEERPFLHFEVCYYQAIDFALSRGLKRVEAGAQGSTSSPAAIARSSLFGA